MSEPDLLPCPDCGTEAREITQSLNGETVSWVRCPLCGGHAFRPQWNTRAALVLRAETEVLLATVDDALRADAWLPCGAQSLKLCPYCLTTAMEGEVRCSVCGGEPDDDKSWRSAPGDMP